MNLDESTPTNSLSRLLVSRQRMLGKNGNLALASFSTLSGYTHSTNIRKNLKFCQDTIESKEKQQDLIYFKMRQSLLSKLKDHKKILTGKLNNDPKAHKHSLFTANSESHEIFDTSTQNYLTEDKIEKDSLMGDAKSLTKKNLSHKLPPRYFGILHQRNHSETSNTLGPRRTNIIGLKGAHNKYRIIKAAERIKGSPESKTLRKYMEPLGDSYIIAVNDKFCYEGLYRFSSIEG